MLLRGVGGRRRRVSTGLGIALAGWFGAFVWACTVSENTAAGVVVLGLVGALIAGNAR